VRESPFVLEKDGSRMRVRYKAHRCVRAWERICVCVCERERRIERECMWARDRAWVFVRVRGTAYVPLRA
jgi:hypothetical protein